MNQHIVDKNRIFLHGRMLEPPRLSHTNHGVEFHRMTLGVARLSGAEDKVKVMAPRDLVEGLSLEPGEELSVIGEVRTFNNRSGEGRRLVISAFARELRREEGQEENCLELSGTLCKPPSLRFTPLGRTICDMILAVNRRYGRADYLPCIAWGSLAHRCGELAVGDRIALRGRLQSRIYTKALEDRVEERTAYEVSLMSLMDLEES